MATATLHYIETQADGKLSFTVNTGNTPMTIRPAIDGSFIRRGNQYQFDETSQSIHLITEAGDLIAPSIRTIEPSILKRSNQVIQSEFDIDARFNYLGTYLEMILDKELYSLIITGEGGIGKSFTVMEKLNEYNLIEGDDYVIIKGFATAKALYATLYEENGKTLIFDDTDSILKDKTAMNILKGALDTNEKRTISWLSKGFIDDGYPASFDFTGQIIFISNLNANNIDAALLSRSLSADMSMTVKDKIQRMTNVLNKIAPDISLEIKTEALHFMDEYQDVAKEFNFRTLLKLAGLIKKIGIDNDWMDNGKFLLTC